MSSNRSFINKLKNIQKKITNPKLVKFCLIYAAVIFSLGLLIAIIIASLFGPKGFNILDNFISELGSKEVTPFPFILDTIAIICAILFVPIFTYAKKLLLLKPCEKEHRERFINKLISLGYICLLIGDVGFFGIGIFSMDRTTELNLHLTFAAIAFSGIVIGVFFLALSILLKKSPIFCNILAIIMICGPISTVLVYILAIPPLTVVFCEWLIMFSLLSWGGPAYFLLLKEVNLEIKN